MSPKPATNTQQMLGRQVSLSFSDKAKLQLIVMFKSKPDSASIAAISFVAYSVETFLVAIGIKPMLLMSNVTHFT